MIRLEHVALAITLAVGLPLSALAQTGGQPTFQQAVAGVAGAAADAEMNRIRADSGSTGHSVDAIRRGILTQGRAFGSSGNSIPTSTMNSLGGSSMFAPSQLGGGKPFAGMQQSSTISPYLNLFNQGPTGRPQTLDNYNLLVRPMLDQQRMNSQMQRQQMQMNMQVQQIAARPDFEFAGSERIIPTGHQTGFGYYSHFYPRMQQVRRQK